jgi:2-polyprenyl-6-methoxyphenol hydroxylase-like FAD-dependent oxidoreductase
MYDVIVVGARVAGSATAMLLGRQGLRVLLVDQAAFPSDTLSTHQIQTPGVARLRRWGLLDRIAAAGTPPAPHVRFDTGSVVLAGRYPEIDGAGAVYSPRRTLLDGLMVDAARAARVEVREKFQVEEIIVEQGRAAGIRGRSKGGAAQVEDRARLVVGADGKHSMVASSVGAPTLTEKPPQTFAAYTYYQGVESSGGELYSRESCSAGMWPTNDGLVMTFVSWPAVEFAKIRADIEGAMLRAFDQAGDLGQRVRAGRRAEKIRATTDTPNRIRRPYGPGWALVGDAGLVMDPITGQGISHAFIEAELLTDAVTAVFQRGAKESAAFKSYQSARDRQIRAMYDFTVQLASFTPRSDSRVLFAALDGRQSEIDRFLGVMTGSIHLRDYMSLPNMIRLVGWRGLAKMMRGTAAARSINTAVTERAGEVAAV